jgi:hypothetical protein
MTGPSGAIEPLDPATKVVEFESLGVKVGAVHFIDGRDREQSACMWQVGVT